MPINAMINLCIMLMDVFGAGVVWYGRVTIFILENRKEVIFLL